MKWVGSSTHTATIIYSDRYKSCIWSYTIKMGRLPLATLHTSLNQGRIQNIGNEGMYARQSEEIMWKISEKRNMSNVLFFIFTTEVEAVLTYFHDKDIVRIILKYQGLKVFDT